MQEVGLREVRLRPMTLEDLPAVAAWLQQPHVARWWTPETVADAELARYRARITRAEPRTHMLTIECDGVPVGWCQWYRWADYPAEGAAIGATAEEIGIDYAIGDPDAVGGGVGTAMIAALVAEVRRTHAGAGLRTTPEAENTGSRRVLEKNGFVLVDERPVETEPHDRPMAIYRLAALG